MVSLIIGLAVFIGLILIFRAVGAWMLRIDEVISELKLIRKELRESASE